MHFPDSPFLQVLEGRIRIERTPFSDRGSRILLFQDVQKPHSLYIKLAERLTSLTPGLSAYRNRPPFIVNLHLIDGDGNPQPYDLISYPHALVFETPIGQFAAAFQDQETLVFHPPPGIPAGIRFAVLPDLARPDGQGGEFKSVRNCAYSTNAPLILNRIANESPRYEVALAIEGDVNSAISLNIRGDLELNRTVRPWRETIAAAEERWHTWFSRVPVVHERLRSHYYYAWWVLGVNLLAPQGLFHRESVAPSKAHYVGAWQWDNYFHALAFRYNDPSLAADQILFMLEHQQANGMIPDAIYDEGRITHLEIPVAAAVTKPPIAAWATMHLFDHTGDATLLREVYEPLVRWNSWWFGLNDDDNDGIVQYSHPFSSGLDDSPLWDEGMPVEAVDLNTYLVIQMQSLSRMARIIGREIESTMWERKSRALLNRIVEHFYDPAAGLFWSQKDHHPIRVLTPFSLYPLWTGGLSPEITQRLVSHLTNPQQFWCPNPLPTVAVNDPKYNPNQMWRGPTWININHIFVEALQRSGFKDLAAELTEHTLQLVMGQTDIYEYYHPATGEAPPKAAPMFGWSAACFIDLAIRMSRNEI